jgi:hypothetical protein
MNMLTLPLLIRLIQLAFPQVGAAIGAGIPIINAVTSASPNMIPLLEQIGGLV